MTVERLACARPLVCALLLAGAALVMVAVAVLLPFTPVAGPLGFVRPSWTLLAGIAGLVVVYLALVDQGKRVVLPVLLADNDLDWAPYSGPESVVPAGRGLLEPVAPRLGPDSIATADVVLVPGLAVSGAGDRLGRGGGSYDRALGRVPVGTPVVVLLHDGEVGLEAAVRNPAHVYDRGIDSCRSGRHR